MKIVRLQQVQASRTVVLPVSSCRFDHRRGGKSQVGVLHMQLRCTVSPSLFTRARDPYSYIEEGFSWLGPNRFDSAQHHRFLGYVPYTSALYKNMLLNAPIYISIYVPER